MSASDAPTPRSHELDPETSRIIADSRAEVAALDRALQKAEAVSDALGEVAIRARGLDPARCQISVEGDRVVIQEHPRLEDAPELEDRCGA